MNPRSVLNPISSEAEEVYRLMVEHMEEDGFVDFEGCLEISMLGVDREGGMKALGANLSELQQASLVFPHYDRSGWVVKLPAVEI